jgi:pimeloyl-ACP methyl ester carboxylesterase
MDYQFADFDTSHFRAEPRRTAIGPWTVEHLSFGAPATLGRAPLVFIGGAFQNAWSFLREVRHFIDQRPVILVDLPGQGQNNQLSEGLSFRDFATVLRQFLDEHRIDRIVPVGLSYGSGIAYTFALHSPDRVERLMLGGTTEQIRPRVHDALVSSFWYLDNGRDDLFAAAVIHHLLNLSQRATTGVSDRIVDSLRLGMMELSDVERLRYRHNSTRLFADRLEGRVTCKTLVFTATHDHFTAPFEAWSLAQRCTPCEFVMIERGDHLAPVENPRTVIALYDAFLNDRPLTDIPGVRTGAAAVDATKERRLLDRRDGRRRDVRMTLPDGSATSALLLDYNAHGCLIEPSQGRSLLDASEPVHVAIPAIGAESDAVLLPDARGLRAIFLQDAFNTLGKMPVMTVEMPVPSDVRLSGRRISIAQRLAILPEE